MKSLKKVLAALLAICMICSLNVFAEEKVLTDIDSSTLVGKAVKELVSLSIIDGYEDGTFRPDNTVTRAEMAKLIVTFMRLDNIGLSSGETGFADVDSTNHWSQPYVKVAIAKGIIVGYDDGTFKPDNPVKFSEAVKMVVCALGYGPVAQSRANDNSPWYAGYISVAAEKGVLDGAATNTQEDPASRGIVAILLYNGLDVKVGDISTGKNGQTVVSTTDKTARETYQQSEKLKGIVTAVYQTGLDRAQTGLSKKMIEVKSGNKAETYRIDSSIDAYTLLGYSITANINQETIDEYYSLESIAKDSRNSVTEVKADNIYSVSTSGIEFWASETATKKSKISFDPNVAVIYNGRYIDEYTDEDFDVHAGSIKIIDNDGDNLADVVFINSYEIIAIKNVGTDSTTERRKIYALYNEGDIIIPQAGKYVKVTNSAGAILDDPQTLTAAKYDIANLLRSKDGEIFDLTITKNKVAGEITSLISDTRIAIKNTEYDIAHNLQKYTGTDKPTFKLSAFINAYLDINGDIAAAEVSSSSENSTVYAGYLLFGEREKGMDGQARVKLYGLAGITGEKTFNLTQRVTIDGTVFNDYDKMLSYLKSTSEEVNEGKSEYGIQPTEYAQLIRYTLKNNEIDTIDTVKANVAVANDDLDLALQFPSSAGRDKNGRYTYISGNKFQNTSGSTVMALNSSTKILVVPDDMTDLKKFRIVSSSYFTQQAGRRVEGYNISNVGVASYVLVYGGIQEATFNENSNISIAKSITLVNGMIDGDEVEQDRLIGWNFKTGTVIDNVKTTEKGILYGKVEQGEIFRYLEDSNYNIDEIDMVLEIGDDKDIVFLPNVNGGNALQPVSSAADAKKRRDYKYDSRSAEYSVCRLIYGTVLSREDNVLKITNTLLSDECGIDDTASEVFNCAGSTKVFVIDYTSTDSNNRVHADITLDEIQTYENNGDEASQVLLFYQSSTVRTVIIIKRPIAKEA